MNTKLYKQMIALIGMMLLISPLSFSQPIEKSVEKTYEVSPFSSIEINGVLKVTIVQGENYRVYIDADERTVEEFNPQVKNNKLILNTSRLQNPIAIKKIVVTAPEFTAVVLTGASTLTTDKVIETESFTLEASGATKATLTINTNFLSTEQSGASKVTLNGFVSDKHTIAISGAALLYAKDLETNETKITASGASKAKVNAVHRLYGELSGLSKLSYDNKPETVEVSDYTATVSGQKANTSYTDSVSVKLGKLNVKVIDGDSTVIIIGNKKLVVDDEGNINLTKEKRQKTHKFNGHWQGVDLGINMLMNSDFNFPTETPWLDLRYEKSISLGLNLVQKNFRLNEKGTIGLYSGLGLLWDNYRFANDVTLFQEKDEVRGYFMEGVNVRKSKLTNNYLTLPLFLELQSASTKSTEKLFVAVGVTAGWRFRSHTKIYYNEAGKSFDLIDPVNGELYKSLESPNARGRNIVKDFTSFHQNPFRLDAGLRMGWSELKIFANYSLTPLFVKNRGPEVYPFTVGISVGGN